MLLFKYDSLSDPTSFPKDQGRFGNVISHELVNCVEILLSALLQFLTEKYDIREKYCIL